jgi:PAS domain S-box-containing protein
VLRFLSKLFNSSNEYSSAIDDALTGAATDRAVGASRAAGFAVDPIVDVPRKGIIVRSGLWMLVLSLVLSVGFVFLYRAEVSKNRTLRMAYAWQSVNLSEQLFAEELNHAFSDLGLLARQNDLSELLNGGGNAAAGRLGKQFRALLATHQVYDQARFINAEGREVVRVNFNDGAPVLVTPQRLQDKGGRYYFQHTMGLEPGQVYLSLFDLNLEEEELELPIKPVLRMATPVGDASGQTRGMVVLNYLGSYLIDRIIAADRASGGNTWLFDDKGYWLKGPSSDDEWGFMFSERSERTVANDYPQIWQHLQSSDEGQFFTGGFLYTFVKVYPQTLVARRDNSLVTYPESYHWTLVSAVPESVLGADNIETGWRLLALYALMLLFAAPLSWLLARLSIRHKALAAAMTRVLNNIPVLVSYVDADKRFRFTNAAYEKFFGVNQGQLIGRSVASLVGEGAYRQILPYMERALEGEQVSFQQRITLRDDSTRMAAASYLPDISSEGHVRGFFGVVNDITELHLAQERERQRLFELAHAQRVNSMGELATEIAHEINQPLTSISNFSTACERTLQSGQWNVDQLTGWIAEIRSHAKRASEVVRRLRTFLMKGESEYAPVDINTLIQDVVGWMESEMRKLKIDVSLDLQQSIPDVMADDILVDQVILNLVRNAMEALAEVQAGTRRLIISSSTSSDEIRVAVSDSGPGIPEEMNDRIFYSFITSKEQGLGMGLSVSRSIVEAHGGRLYLDSGATSMTTFIFTIPLTADGSHG